MLHQTRLVASLILAGSTTLLLGCDEQSNREDPLAAIAVDFTEVVRNRPAIRASADETDDSASNLRQLASRARSAGTPGADLLASRILLSAGTFDYDEALRLESKAARLRALARRLAADADRLARSAASAEQLDLSEATRMTEGWMDEARRELGIAEDALAELGTQIGVAEDQRNANLAKAAQFEAIAVERAEEGIDLGPLDGVDAINESIYFRQQADERRIAAARDDTAILTLQPALTLTTIERENQRAKSEHATESRRTTEGRLDTARTYANDVRRQLATIADTVGALLDEAIAIETEQILPRLEASVGDFQSAATIARSTTRGGSRGESDNGWRSIASAQFNAGRSQWEAASVLGRRGETLARMSQGVLLDPNEVGSVLDGTNSGREEALAAAETSFNEALSSLSNVSGDATGNARLRQSIESAIASLKGDPIVVDVTPASTSGGFATGGGAATPASTGGSSAISGDGFGTPAEAARFLSDPDNQMSKAGIARIEAAIKADTPQGKAIKNLLTIGSIAVPLMEAMTSQFGQAATEGAMSGDFMDSAPSVEFEVDSVDGNVATLKSKDGSQSLKLVKGSNGWIVDADKTIADDPQVAMMIEFMGPMIDAMLKPMQAMMDSLAQRVESGEFSSAAEAMQALEEEMADAMPGGGGGGGGFPGGGGGGGLPGGGGGLPGGFGG